MRHHFSTGRRVQFPPFKAALYEARPAPAPALARAANSAAPLVEHLENRRLLSTSTIAPPATVSPVVSVSNTANEGTNQLIAPAVSPAATTTVKGNNGGDATAPTPVITLLGANGSTPHSVFVHALDSVLGAGTPLTARYQWNFGDPGSEYNTLVGWNAAHTYDKPGVYTITLTLTNSLGKTRVLSTTVTEGSPQYAHSIYVDSASGNDASSGASPSSPIKTITRAMELMGSNTQLLFHAGETFPDTTGMGLPFQNILVGSYGTGANPILMREPGNGSSHIGLLASSQNVVVQDITFDSVYVPVGGKAEEMPANGIAVAGTDITIRNCTFLNLDYAITETGNPQGVLIQDNTAPLATGLRGYLVWGQGTDQVIIGNYDANSTRQHDIRTVDTIRQLIAYNNLTNLDRRSLGDAGDYSKGTIEVHRGSYAYVANNVLFDGDLRVGPRTGPSVTAGDTNQWDVVEGNHTNNLPFEIFPGTSHVMVRNNIFSTNTGPLISMTPKNATGDNVSDITYDNNTGISSSVAGEFIQIGQGGANGAVTLEDNLWLAPLIVPGTHMDAAIFIEDPDPGVLKLSAGNVWQMPATFNRYADGGINYVNPSWDPPNGYYTPAAWDALPFVDDDHFAATVVSANDTPAAGSVAATGGVAVPGVFVDIYGNPRPASGPISAGAVQAPWSGQAATGSSAGATGAGASTSSGSAAGAGQGSSSGNGSPTGTGTTTSAGGATSGSGKSTSTGSGAGSGTGASTATGSGATTGTGGNTSTAGGATSGSGKSTSTSSGAASGTGATTSSGSGSTTGTGGTTSAAGGATSGSGKSTSTSSGAGSGTGASTATGSGSTTGTGGTTSAAGSATSGSGKSTSTGSGAASGTGASTSSGSGSTTGTGGTTSAASGATSGSGKTSSTTGAHTTAGAAGNTGTGAGTTSGSGSSSGTAEGAVASTGSTTSAGVGTGTSTSSTNESSTSDGDANANPPAESSDASDTPVGVIGPIAPSDRVESSPSPTIALVPISPAEASTPPVDALKTKVSADHDAIAQAQSQRKTTLAQLLATRHLDAAALHSAMHQLALARSGRSTQQFRASIADLNNRIAQLKQTITSDTIAIAQANHSGFTGIASARQQLADDVRLLAATIHKHA